jgi:NADH-quinone oxidoreductase subunit N
MTSLLLFGPEAVCLLVALVLFFCSVFEARYATTWLVALIGSLAVCAVAILVLPVRGEPFSPGIYKADFFSQLVKVALAAGLLLTIIASREPRSQRATTWAELPMFLAVSTAGMMMLVSATELLTIYVALELSAYPLYIMVALSRSRRSGSESAAKYMLQGMASSAVTLYGISFLYGTVGSTYLSAIVAKAPELAGMPLFWLGMGLALAGFLFKLAAFPFHFWAPDTYQAAPHQAVMFIATSSKVAAVALLVRLTGLMIGNDNGAGAASLHTALLVISVAAMTLGNLAAIAQKDLKRLLGYSAVAHAGYVLIGLQTFSPLGLTSSLFYVFGYLAMGFLCFLVVCEVGRDLNYVPIEALAGLHKRSPILALALLVGIFGLTGLPPTVGFIGKWFLFSAALEQGQFWLVLIAAANSAVALYYYMRIIRQAYLLPPATDEELTITPLTATAAVVVSVVVVWMGTAPNLLWIMAESAVAAIIGNV